ncbi:hypothetical protein Tco_0314043 [Tanacetum coccineum]
MLVEEESCPVYDTDNEEESMPVYDTDIEDVIEVEEGFVGKGGIGGEEDNIEDDVVVANDICSSMIQTTLNVNTEEDINTKSHELMLFGKSIIIKGVGAEVEHPEPRFTYETEEIRAILDVVQSNDLYNMMMLRLVPFSKENVNIQYESVMGKNPKVNHNKLISKYAFLWPDSLLLSTDSHNVLLSSTALQVWIVIKVHLHDQRRFLVYPLMEQYNFRSFLSVFAGGVIVDEVSLIIKLFAYDHRVSFTNHAFSTYFINLLGMFDGIPPKSEGSRQSFPFTTKFKIRLHLLDSDRWQNLWASSVKVPVANVTLSSSALLAMSENTDSVCSNQRMRNFFRSSVSIKIVGICNGSSLLLPGCRNPASKLPG